MTRSIFHFTHGLMRLVIGMADIKRAVLVLFACAALINKAAAHFKITLFARCFIKLNERKLDFFVTGS